MDARGHVLISQNFDDLISLSYRRGPRHVYGMTHGSMLNTAGGPISVVTNIRIRIRDFCKTNNIRIRIRNWILTSKSECFNIFYLQNWLKINWLVLVGSSELSELNILYLLMIILFVGFPSFEKH